MLAWAQAWPQRTWAIEGAGGLGHLLAQQLLAAGEQVVDVQPKLGARVRLLAAGDTNKNDPNDARSVAVAALTTALRYDKARCRTAREYSNPMHMRRPPANGPRHRPSQTTASDRPEASSHRWHSFR